VGRVTEVNVATGEIEFFIDKAPIPDTIGIEYAASDVLQLKDGGVTTAKIAASAVTAAKLADVVADLIPQLADITHDNEGDTQPDTIRFTLQVQDAQGNSVGRRCTLFVYVSDTNFGDPVTITTLTAATGTDIPITLAQSIMVVTDVNGQALIDAEWIGVGTRYLIACLPTSAKSSSATWS
jgi:hypothetical protein